MLFIIVMVGFLVVAYYYLTLKYPYDHKWNFWGFIGYLGA
jgi:hypothetical protein